MRRRQESSPSTGASAAAIAAAWAGRAAVTRAAANAAAAASAGAASNAAAAIRAGVTRSSPSLASRRNAVARASASGVVEQRRQLVRERLNDLADRGGGVGAQRGVGVGRERAQRRGVGPAVERRQRIVARVAAAREGVGEQVLQLARVSAPERRQVRRRGRRQRQQRVDVYAAVRRAGALRRVAPRLPAMPPALPAARSRRASAYRRGSSARASSGSNAARIARPGQRHARPPARDPGSPESRSSTSAGDTTSRMAALRAEAWPSPMMAARLISVGRFAIGGQREQRLQRTGGRLAAKPETGGRDDTGLSAVERLDQLRRRRRVGKTSQAPDRDGPKSVVRVGPGIARERGAGPRIAESRQRGQRRELQIEPRRGVCDRPGVAQRRHFQLDAGRAPGAGRAVRAAIGGSLSRIASRTSAGAASPLPSMPIEIDDRPLRRLVGLGHDLEQRTQHAAAERATRIVHVRVAVHRRQKPLEQRRQQPAACRRVLARRKRVRELRFEIGQSALAGRRAPAPDAPPRVMASSSCDARNSWFSASAASCSLPRRMSSRASASVAAGFVSCAMAAR